MVVPGQVVCLWLYLDRWCVCGCTWTGGVFVVVPGQVVFVVVPEQVVFVVIPG